MLGRCKRPSPQFISISDGSWLGTSATIERITHRSSMCAAAVRAKSSLTAMPLWPYCRKAKGDPRAAPVFRSVRRLGFGRFLPWYFASIGLGSKVSTCDGPPFMNRWTTCLALPGKCGDFGAIGPSEPDDDDPVRTAGIPPIARSSARTPARPSSPNPMPDRPSSSRRVRAEVVSRRHGKLLDMAELLWFRLRDAVLPREGAHRPRHLLRGRVGPWVAWSNRSGN